MTKLVKIFKNFFRLTEDSTESEDFTESEDSKSLLILKCSNVISIEEELVISNFCRINKIEPLTVDISRISEIPKGSCFDMIYICGHGNVQSVEIADSNGLVSPINWSDVAFNICTKTCVQDSATIFCACCRGGLNYIAESFFDSCPAVEFVIGPESNVYPGSLILAFETVLYSLLNRRCDPQEACEIATNATGNKYILHDRQKYLDKVLSAA